MTSTGKMKSIVWFFSICHFLRFYSCKTSHSLSIPWMDFAYPFNIKVPIEKNWNIQYWYNVRILITELFSSGTIFKITYCKAVLHTRIIHIISVININHQEFNADTAFVVGDIGNTCQIIGIINRIVWSVDWLSRCGDVTSTNINYKIQTKIIY